MADLPPIPYGLSDTQFGVITQPTPDGGILLTIPFGTNFLGEGGRMMDLIRSATHQFPHRAIVTLDHSGLTAIESHDFRRIGSVRLADGSFKSHWPLASIGEIRHNCYGKGVYVSITGQDNFDWLTDLDKSVVRYVADTLERTLASLLNQNTSS